MESLSDATVVDSSETAVGTTVDGEAVILETESGTYYSLNGVATHIWNCLTEPRTVAELREEILATYAVDEERCDRDLKAALTEMDDIGLVQLG